MRIESEHDGRPGCFARLGQKSLDNFRMPAVYAVEIADCHRAAAHVVGQMSKFAQQLHSAKLQQRSSKQGRVCYLIVQCWMGSTSTKTASMDDKQIFLSTELAHRLAAIDIGS